jgi:iron complex outermembrane receptor protein
MSELIQKNDNRTTIRWKLLTGASALVLTAYVSSAGLAQAEDASQPQLWIELGGQLNRQQASLEPYAPPFAAMTPSIFAPPQNSETPPAYGFDETAAMTFQPKGSDWLFSASIRYGRASGNKHVRQQSYPGSYAHYSKQLWERNFQQHHAGSALTFMLSTPPIAARFSDLRAKQSEIHTIVDFQAGKDVGLGLFGGNASSSLDVGIRFAQFTSRSRVALDENPDWGFVTGIYKHNFTVKYVTRQEVYQPYHSFSGKFQADRDFHGIGPSLTWNSSVPFAGNSQDGELTLDWGVNGSVLFGRQRVKMSHQTTGRYHVRGNTRHHNTPGLITTYQNPATPHTRSRNVTVPNVGGSVGLSWKLQNFKMSLGYRADFFFNAIDGGIDARKSENRAFYGPYASISIGLGD